MDRWCQLFDLPVAPLAAWRARLGEDFSLLSRLLLPTGGRADFLPCPLSPTTGCGWCVNHETGRAVCPEGRCEPIEVEAAACAMMGLNTPLLHSALAKSLQLGGKPDATNVGGLLGWIAPVQTARFPVFISTPPAPREHFGQLQRFAERAGGAFVIILPSRHTLDLEASGLLRARNALTVFMDEDVDIDDRGEIEAHDARLVMEEFALVRAGIKQERKLPTFPTPRGAGWPDIRITAPNDHTVLVTAIVRFGGSTTETSQTYTFEDLCMVRESADRPTPNKDWDDFFLPLVLHRRVTARGPKEWNRLKTAKKKVARILGAVTGLDPADAITDHRGKSCYEAAFAVECEPGQETPVPGDPRQLAEGEEEVWMNRRPTVIPRNR